MNNKDFLKKIERLTKNTSFTSDINKINYFIHRIFYILESENLINEHNKFDFSFNEKSLKDKCILPKNYDLVEFLNEKLIYNQEYKCHYLVKCERKEENIFFSIKKDMFTIPKIIYKKEYSTFKVMKEIRK